MVGRPREFDVDNVLDAAMRAFWANGYEATSLSDLMKATGLHKGSLYQAFGDKRSLFLKSLERYLDSSMARDDAIMADATSPLDGILKVVHTMIDMESTQDCPSGCLAINSMVELGQQDEGVEKIIAKHHAKHLEKIAGVFAAAQQAGEISKNRPPELIAMMMMTFMTGLAAMAKGAVDVAVAHELIDQQIDLLK